MIFCFQLFVKNYVMDFGQCLHCVPEVPLCKFLLTHAVLQLLKVQKNWVTMRQLLIYPWWWESPGEWEFPGFPVIGGISWGPGGCWAGWRFRRRLVLVSLVTRRWLEHVVIMTWSDISTLFSVSCTLVYSDTLHTFSCFSVGVGGQAVKV